MNPPILYKQSQVSPQDNDDILKVLWNNLGWLRLPGTPRREYYCATRKDAVYTYGTPPRHSTYFPMQWDPLLLALKREAEDLAGCAFEALFINGYENERDSLGWHADDSALFDHKRPILVRSYGAEREIWFRKTPPFEGKCVACSGVGNYDNRGAPKCDSCNGTGKADKPEVAKLELEHGSSLIMLPGMQQTHQHRIPRAGFKCGPRISLTFRGLS